MLRRVKTIHVSFIESQAPIKAKDGTGLELVQKYCKPENIISELKDAVVGQEEALKKIALVAAQRDAVILLNNERPNGKKMKPAKIILSGDSGCGKTFLVHQIADLIKSKLIRIDISQYTQSGYVGNSVSDIFSKTIPDAIESQMRAGKSRLEASRIIVFLDEIDKISGSVQEVRNNVSTTVMNELLVAFDEYESCADLKQEHLHNILWVFAGSFSRYRDVKAQKNNKAGIGFGSKERGKETKSDYKMELKDYEEAGIPTEFMGRIGHCVTLNPMTKKSLEGILKNDKVNPLKDLYSVCEKMGVKVNLTSKDYDNIIKETLKKGIGARGLRVAAEEIIFKGF